MEDQIPPSQPPMPKAPEGQITPEMVAQLKARAKELALQQAIAQQASMPTPQAQPQLPMQPQPQIVYLRRNLTVAELLLVILLSCGIVTGIQVLWNVTTNLLPRIEIKVR